MLKRVLPRNLYALDFSANHYSRLLSELNIAENEELFNLKKGALIEAIIEYFNLSFQNITVVLSFTNCSISKQFIDAGASESLDRIMHSNSQLLIDIAKQKEEYHILTYLLSIPEETRNILLKRFIDTNMDIDKARTLIRLQTQQIFNLGERDITFFLRGRIWIRYYFLPKKVAEGQDKRYAGESEEDLMAMYQKYFPDGMWAEIEDGLNEVIKEKLNFSSIDNITFRNTFIPVFRGMIEVLLIDVLSQEERTKIEGFSGYVLRKYFDQILLFTAKNLLSFVEIRDKNAEKFIKYFSEDVIMDTNGNKIQKYAIIDVKQQRWNYISIHSVLMQYKQAKLRILTQNEIVSISQGQVTQSEKELGLEKKNKKEQEDIIEKINIAISEIEMKSLRNKKSGSPSSLTAYSKDYQDLITDKKAANNLLDLINNRIKNKIIELTRHRKKLASEIKTEETISLQIAPLKESYEGIAHGLAVVLTKR